MMNDSMKDPGNSYLLEIGLEEMPAGMLLPAVEQLKQNAEKTLETLQMQYVNIKPFSTPRTLALLLRGFPERQEDRVQELKGPPA